MHTIVASYAHHLKRHVKMHSGDKSIKFDSPQVHSLHLIRRRAANVFSFWEYQKCCLFLRSFLSVMVLCRKVFILQGCYRGATFLGLLKQALLFDHLCFQFVRGKKKRGGHIFECISVFWNFCIILEASHALQARPPLRRQLCATGVRRLLGFKIGH